MTGRTVDGEHLMKCYDIYDFVIARSGRPAPRPLHPLQLNWAAA